MSSTAGSTWRRNIGLVTAAVLAATLGQGVVSHASSAATVAQHRHGAPALPPVRSTHLTAATGVNAADLAAEHAALARRNADAARALAAERVAAAAGGGRAAQAQPDGASSGNGDYTATPMTPSSQWAAGSSSGSFTWAYPMRTPQAAAGPQPQIALNYDSGSVDGRTPASNNQGSQVGEGFELTSSYITRSYASCHQDGQPSSYDLCWRGGQVSLVLNGQSARLVKVDATTYRLAQDDGSRIQLLTTGNPNLNGDNDGEHWLLTTPNGTGYSFGLNKLPGATTDSPTSNSTWTVPVFGNDPGEPCHGDTFATSSCQQAWQWNLDYVVDPHGNASTYWYTAEHNNYAKNGDTDGTDYIRGGHLTAIDYGLRATALFTGDGSAATAPDRVTLTATDRCTAGADCGGGPLGHATFWPDVPTDSICNDGVTCTGDLAATFFTTSMLGAVTTQVYTGGAYQDVDTWTLTQQFLAPADDTDYHHHVLWLSSIGRRADDGDTPITLPIVQLSDVFMDNRVDAPHDDIPALSRPRIASIQSESGQLTFVTYSGHDCTAQNKPANIADNHMRCFPVYWTQPDATVATLDWFHKYDVDSVIVGDPAQSTSPDVETDYTYSNPSWHYAASPTSQRDTTTWSEWRGFSQVATTTGIPSDPARLKSVSVYLQGMNGDRDGNGGTKTVSVTGIEASPVTDADQYAGFTRETVIYNGVGGPEVSDTVNDPWFSSTATETFPAQDGYDQVVVKAWMVRIGAATTATTIGTGGSATVRTHTVSTDYNDDGFPTAVSDTGDTAITGDEACSRTWYARNTTAWIVDLAARAQTLATTCDNTGSARLPRNADTAGDVISDSANLYDGATGWSGQTPGAGDITTIQRVTGYTAAGDPNGWQDVLTNQYDTLGRVTSSTDADHNTTTTGYVPAGAGTPQSTAVTNAKQQTTATTLEAAWGNPTTVVDPNGLTATYTYDALGRVTALWLPNNPYTPQTPASRTYGYHLSQRPDDSSWVSTSVLKGTYTGYNTSYQFYDALLRPIQTQTTAAELDGAGHTGRIVTQTTYDDRGLPIEQSNDIYDSTSPPVGTLATVSQGAAPAQYDTSYDGAARPLTSTFSSSGTARWSTTASYTGDSVATTAPAGGSATRVYTDARGRTTQQLVYAGATPTGAHRTTAYTYLPTGQVGTVTAPDGAAWTYGYDLYGRVTSSSDPDQGASTTTYTDLDQVDTTTDARHTTLLYSYDSLGRPTGRWAGSRTDATKLAGWTYDNPTANANGIGQLANATSYLNGVNQANSLAYTKTVDSYSGIYQPIKTDVTIPTTDTLVTAGAVPSNGTLTFTTDYNGRDGSVQDTRSPPLVPGLSTEVNSMSYNDAGLPTALSGFVLDTVYRPLGDLSQRTFGTSQTTQDKAYLTNTYDIGTRRLTRSDVSDDIHGNVPGGYADATHVYSYDDAGNLLEDADKSSLGGAGNKQFQCYGYDDGYQDLTQVWTPATNDCAVSGRTTDNLGGAAPYWNSYAYGLGGRRTIKTSHATAGNTKTTYAYNATCTGATAPYKHALTSTTTQPPTGTPTTSPYGCDANGATTTRPGKQAPTQTLTWNAAGQLATIHENATADKPAYTETSLYDADGTLLIRRTTTNTTSSSVLYAGNTETHLDTDAGVTTITGQRTYALGGQQVAIRTATAGTGTSAGYYTFPDPHGTVDLTLQRYAPLTITKRYLDEFGGLLPHQPTWPDNKRFLGKTFDSTAGLTHLGAREYDTTLGAFISVDPILNTNDPLSLNGYTYADNNPTGNTDPTGTMLSQEGNGGDSSKDRGYDRSWLDDLNLSGADTAYFNDELDKEDRALIGTYTPYTQTIVSEGEILSAGATVADYAFTGGVVHSCSGGVSLDCAIGLAAMIPIGRGLEAVDYAARLERASTAARASLDLSKAAEDGPLASGKLYVNGSKSANNLTPRLTDTDGLSSFDTLEAGVKPGGKGQCFEVACLGEGGLGAFKTGPPGHYSIRPLEPGGMDAWLASRAAGTEAESPFTEFLQSIAETVWNR